MARLLRRGSAPRRSAEPGTPGNAAWCPFPGEPRSHPSSLTLYVPEPFSAGGWFSGAALIVFALLLRAAWARTRAGA